MGIKFTDNAYGTLSAAVTAEAVTLSLTNGDVAKFPVLEEGDYFYLTLFDAATLEVVKCTAVVGNNLTVVRSDGAQAWPLDTAVELRLVSKAVGDIIALSEAGDAAEAEARTEAITAVEAAQFSANTAITNISGTLLGFRVVTTLGLSTVDLPARTRWVVYEISGGGGGGTGRYLTPLFLFQSGRNGGATTLRYTIDNVVSSIVVRGGFGGAFLPSAASNNSAYLFRITGALGGIGVITEGVTGVSGRAAEANMGSFTSATEVTITIGNGGNGGNSGDGGDGQRGNSGYAKFWFYS